jgi:hypothetical protein
MLDHPRHSGALLLVSEDNLGSYFTLLKQLPPLFTEVPRREFSEVHIHDPA